MHELGIVYEVIKVVDGFVKENNLTYVDKIVLEVGQLSQAIPRFIEECYPAAVDDTDYRDTKLEIILMPAMGKCENCLELYNIVDHRRICPSCGKTDYEILSGQEFNIKEILGY